MQGLDHALIVVDRPVDDPQVRRPDTTLAERALGWNAVVPPLEGPAWTVAWYADRRT